MATNYKIQKAMEEKTNENRKKKSKINQRIEQSNEIKMNKTKSKNVKSISTNFQVFYQSVR